MTITACTGCGTRFKVAPDKVGKGLTCPKCGERFRISAEGGKPGKGQTAAIVWCSVVVGILAVGFLAYKLGFGSKKPLENFVSAEQAEENARIARNAAKKDAPAPAAKPLTGDEAIKARAFELFVALRTGDEASLAKWIEYSRFHEAKRAAGDSAKPWLQLAPEDQYAAREALHAELIGSGSQKLLIERGAVANLEITEPGKQVVGLRATLKDPLSDRKQVIDVKLESIAGLWKLIRFDRGPLEGEAGASGPTAAVEPPKAARRIANPEADPTSVDPLPDETGLDRGTIDRTLDVLKDTGATTASAKARKEIVAVGKPAIPHLLNALIPLDFSKPEDLIVAQRLTTALMDITGADYPIAPGGIDGTMLGDTKDGNETNRRRWFGWWREHHATFKAREAGSFEDEAEDGAKKDGGGK